MKINRLLHEHEMIFVVQSGSRRHSLESHPRDALGGRGIAAGTTRMMGTLLTGPRLGTAGGGRTSSLSAAATLAGSPSQTSHFLLRIAAAWQGPDGRR